MASDYSDIEKDEVKVLTVKEMAPELQPREKAAMFGIDTLSVAELLAVILRAGVPGMPITEMMRTLLRDNDNLLHTLERRSPKELSAYRGIGETKQLQLQAIFQLIKRYNGEELPDRPQIRSSRDIYNVMRDHIGNLPHEEIWALTLDHSNRIITRHKLTVGGKSSSVFDLKMVLKRALLDEASGLILCHNHPSGNLRPSPQDDQITRRCARGAEALDLRMLDHLIVTAGGYYSYADSGKM